VTGPESDSGETRPVLFSVKGDASPEEVAALAAVLQGIAASAAPPAPRARSTWAAPQRRVRTPHAWGPGAWRASALPR
jgi:hypothetical protein